MELIRYDKAKQALAEVKNFDEVKDIRDKATALEAYARQAKDTEMIQWATEIKIRAERKAGEMLRDAKAAGQVATAGSHTDTLKQNRSSSLSTNGTPFTPKPATLAEIGITKDESSRYQKLAAIPEEHFETAVDSVRKAAGAVSAAAVLRKQQPERRDMVKHPFSNAKQFTMLAIDHLTRIRKEDPQRVAALMEVRDYIDAELKKIGDEK